MEATELASAAVGPTTAASAAEQRLVLYGDFNCPWSYLASRRATLLAADGVEVDWRAVEHDAARRQSLTQVPAAPVRLGLLLEEMRQVLGVLLPGEALPYALAGFVSDTSAAIAGYAEAYRIGAAAPVRELLFEALWLHAFDLDDPSVVHTLIIDAVRGGTATTEPLATWEYRDEGEAGEGSSEAGRLIDAWAGEWGEGGNDIVPALAVDGSLFRGVNAVTWLGDELVRRGLDPGRSERLAVPGRRRPSPSLGGQPTSPAQ